MLLIVIGVGLLAGWWLELASEYLPRFAGQPPEQETNIYSPPALWSFLITKNKPYARWFKLHLAMELFGGFAFGLLWYLYGISVEGLLLASAYLFFLLIAIIDLKYCLILNIMMYPSIGIILLAQIMLGQDIRTTLIGGTVILAIFLLVARLRPGQLGAGDVKLALLIGLLFGYPQMFWPLILGAGSGAGAAILLLLSGRYQLKSRIPYAPFLCMGAMVALLHNPFLV